MVEKLWDLKISAQVQPKFDALSATVNARKSAQNYQNLPKSAQR
jgi:hypothetical protein